MPNRILREGILTSERVDMLSHHGELFYRRLMSVVDDFGRFDGRPQMLRVSCFPLRVDRVREADISRWLDELQTAGLIALYAVNGKPFLEMLDFRQQVRAKESRYPSNPGTCAADAMQVLGTRAADAHLDGGGGEDVVVSGDDIPPTTGTREDEESTEQFRMHLAWKPSSHFGELSRMAGLATLPGDDTALGEFIAYWMGQPKRKRTQHEWDHAYLKNLKVEKVRKDAGVGIPVRKGGTTLPPPSEWFMTASGIEAKAAEHGITKQRDEPFPAFKARVYQAAGVTDEMVRRAKIDRGERV